jgi:hypothetical protein
MSWWQSKNGLTESAMLGLAALAGVALSLAALYWLVTLFYHGLFH